MILAVLAIAGVVLFIALCCASLWYIRADWQQEHGYRARVREIWRKQDGYHRDRSRP